MRILLLAFLFLCGIAQASEFLDPEVAFKASARAAGPSAIQVDFDIADGYHLYREKFQFSKVSGEGELGTPIFPRGKVKRDDNFGDVEIFTRHVSVKIPLNRPQNAKATEIALAVGMQGCAEAGLCYPPQSHELKVRLAAPPAQPVKSDIQGPGQIAASELAKSPESSAPSAPTATADESGRIAQSLKHSGLLANLFFFFLAGLGLSLTPCVFPMIPILSGIIAGQGKEVSRRRGLALSFAYVLGMALTYSGAGVAAGLSGTLISASMQNPWVLGSFAAIFVVLSLSMFGFYNLQLPSSLQSRLSVGASHIEGGRALGVFLMGALSALIVGPCVAAPLAGALLYIGQTGNAVLGGAALFSMALGMGVPLLLVGLSAGTLLPKAGMWMEGVKKFFGVLLLGTAVWLVSPVIPAAVQMVAWALLLIVPAIYLHTLDPLPASARGWQRFWKGCGVAMLIVGAAVLLGVLAGNRDPMQPLAGIYGQAMAKTENKLQFEHVNTVADLDARIVSAGQPVMLDFYADWCTSCKEMERFTFSDANVQAKLAGFKLLKADVTGNTAEDKKLLARFGLFGPPGVIFLDASGKEISGKRIVGFLDASGFLKNLDGLI